MNEEYRARMQTASLPPKPILLSTLFLVFQMVKWLDAMRSGFSAGLATIVLCGLEQTSALFRAQSPDLSSEEVGPGALREPIPLGYHWFNISDNSGVVKYSTGNVNNIITTYGIGWVLDLSG